ncbi:MAG: transcription termination factor NusA [Patescibacteria group bacterium]
MLDLKSFTQAIQQLADEKGIARDQIIETIEMALAAAYKRDYGERGQMIRVSLDPASGKAEVRQIKTVVDETMVRFDEDEEEATAAGGGDKDVVGSAAEGAGRPGEESAGAEMEERKVRFNSEKHLTVEEARATHPDAKAGDEIEFPLEYHDDFGRIAAQTAKQVIIQRLREIERETIFQEFKNREGEVASGIIQRMEGRTVFIDLGRAVAALPPEEQIPNERYQVGTRLKAMILAVERNPKGSGVFLSRSHPRLLKKLFEIEVPEIASGAVEIKAVAREAGSRTKVAVTSHEEGVDPVGSMVGQKGVRVSTVIHELNGEKIDIIEWAGDEREFVANSLSPARVLGVELNADRKEAAVTVAEDQLSLAIGKGGQNVRLAAKLTGWKIDVRPAVKPAAEGPAESSDGPKAAESDSS